MSVAAILAFLVAHLGDIAQALFALLTAASLAVALLPESARKAKIVGGIVKAAEFVAFLTHRDSPGTLKAPGTTAVKSDEAAK